MDGITDSMDMSLSKLGNSGGQRSLGCCSPWGHEESDTERLNKSNNMDEEPNEMHTASLLRSWQDALSYLPISASGFSP